LALRAKAACNGEISDISLNAATTDARSGFGSFALSVSGTKVGGGYLPDGGQLPSTQHPFQWVKPLERKIANSELLTAGNPTV